jgi:Dyp-type peroxidase family
MTIRLDLCDIQGNILRGYGSRAAVYIFLTVHDAAAAKAWLADIAPQVTTAAVLPPQRTLNVAVTYPGLRALGLPAAKLATFPRAFRAGMARRGTLLGDTEQNAPERWHPPFHDPDDLHLMVMVTGRDAARVDQRVEELQQGFWQAGLSEAAKPLKACRLKGNREHFGYQDGISQPGVRGIHDEDGEDGGRPLPGQPLQPGEFILGLPDEDSATPALPDPPALARNGSYLVLRKLEQDVVTFRRLLAELAEALGVSEELVAAKVMGRWRDGTPLTQRPQRPDPSLADDKRFNNLFTFDADPDGYNCPVGAHIRRANPRGSLGFGGTLERRHRIIRRGLPYGPPLAADARDDDDDRNRGMVFACYQADIERQFEFVQSQWLNDGNVFGLGADRDPFIGSPNGGSRLMRFEGRPPSFINTLQRTVTVRGGGYFLVPSISALSQLSRLPDPDPALLPVR